jgi:hypothetical protein
MVRIELSQKIEKNWSRKKVEKDLKHGQKVPGRSKKTSATSVISRLTLRKNRLNQQEIKFKYENVSAEKE